jgi:gliding motility-associated-like protein
MERRIIVLISLFISLAVDAQYSIRSGAGEPMLVETRSGVAVYLLDGLSGAEITFNSQNAGIHEWFKYREDAANAVPVASVQNGNSSTVTGLEDGCGYFVASPETLYSYVWIIDYNFYKPKFFGFEATEDEYKCEYLNLQADVEAEPLFYNLPSGLRLPLQRKYTLTYNTLEWQDESHTFIPKTEILEILGNVSEISLEKPPLENTTFTLTGDDFAKHFGSAETVSTDYTAVAIEAHATAETDRVFAENEKQATSNSLGGSAPIEYIFTAYANEPVAALYTWRVIKKEPNGSKTTLVRYSEKVLKYTFEQEGNFIVQLEVSNAKSVCIDTSQIFNVMIGETFIKIPNAFSPGSSIGINDEFRISYQSVISFKASIFNRWGNMLYQWTNPAEGWDGRVNGKFVPTGVYYVIIEYIDSRGKKHSESSDINILRSKSEDSER